MDPTNILNIGLLLVTAIGVAVTAWQAHEARTARDEAETARDQANRAVTAAEVSAGAAQRSASALEAAHQVETSRDERERERSDVAWEWRWDDAHIGHVIIQNIGKSRAVGVVAQFFFEDMTEANDGTPMDVAGREEFRFQIPTLATRRHDAAIKYETQRISGGGYRPELPTARTRLRIVWETPLGTVARMDTDWVDSPLLDHVKDLRDLVYLNPDAGK